MERKQGDFDLGNAGVWLSLLAAAALLVGCGSSSSGGARGSTPPAQSTAPYVFEPRLSLTGSCRVSPADPVPDPGCPYPPRRRPRPFVSPCGVATDRLGYIYVANDGRAGAREGWIDVFDPRGRFVTQIELPRRISERPCRIDVDSRGRIYIAARPLAVPTTGNIDIHAKPIPTAFRYAILRYTPDSFPPSRRTSYGEPIIFALTGESYGVAVDPSDDRVYVASPRLYELTPAGRPVSTRGIDTGGRDIDVWGKNHDVYVSAESLRWKIRVYGGNGGRHPLDVIHVPIGDVPPYVSIAVDQANGNVLVGDIEKHRIDVYARNRRTGRFRPAGVIVHGRYMEKAEGASDLAVDGAPRSPNRGYVFATSGIRPGHVFVFAPRKSPARPR